MVLLIGAGLQFVGDDLAPAASRAVLVFGVAVAAWVVLRADETRVALLAVAALLALGALPPSSVPAVLGGSLLGLLVGAFVVASALRRSGLAERWTLWAVAGAADVSGLMRRLTAVIAATAFVVPSTTGRAALLLPVCTVLVRAVDDVRVARALVLLFPSVILLSAGASLLGAGAHLVAMDLLRQAGVTPPDFLTWALLAAPFALLGSLVASGLIGRLFLSRDERRRALQLPAAPAGPLRPAQRATAVVAGVTVLGWATTPWHGLDAMGVALAGGLLATCRRLTGVGLREALADVEWRLLAFLAATLLLGESLLSSGAAQALVDGLLRGLPPAADAPAGRVVAVAAIALLSHLVVTSRSARVLVLVPVVALPLAGTDLDPTVLVLVAVLGSGYCQTLVVSAKPLAVFARVDGATLDARDLLRLSLWLGPWIGGLLLVFAFLVWPWQGLPWRIA